MKNIHVYSAALPSMEKMKSAVESDEDRIFSDCEINKINSFGFAPDGISAIANGYQMQFMFEEKILPKAAINRESNKRISAEEDLIGVPLEKKYRDLIKERVITEMIEKALTKLTVFNAFYHTASERVFVDVSSEELAGRAIAEMCHAIKSLETMTLHVSGVSNSLTQNIRECIRSNQDLGFSGFCYADKLHLKNTHKESVKFECDFTLEHVAELIDSGYSVKRVRIGRYDVSFDLTEDFKIKSIRHEIEPESDESKEDHARQVNETLLEVMAANVQELVDFFGKSEEEAKQHADDMQSFVQEPKEDTDEPETNPYFDDDGRDVLYLEAVEFVREEKRPSISSIQRKFRIGYNRAANIVEQMEQNGVVSKPGHNGCRVVLEK